MDDAGATPIHGHQGTSPRNRSVKLVGARMLAAGNIHSRKPVIRMEIRLNAGHSGTFSRDWLRKLVAGLPIMRAEILDFPGWHLVHEARAPVPAATAAELLALLLQRSVGWPVSFMGSLLEGRPSGRRPAQPGIDRRVAVFETRQKAVGSLAGRLAVDLCNQLDHATEGAAGEVISDAFRTFRRRTARVTPYRSAIWIASRAEQRGIPWSALAGTSFLRLGRGRYAEILRGFDTSLTSCIASNLAKRKDVAQGLLAAAGLPVAEQRSARSAQAAIAAARAIGYPVVVKPRDGSEGRAVSVNLTTDEEVAAAFAHARTVSPVAVVESLIPGETFRVSVIGGRLFAVAQRHPPRLRGDGVHTVAELIAAENRNPERQPNAPVSMNPIVLDDEMLALLAGQGLSPEDVPEAGRWVLLRRVPNPPYGEKTDVTDIIHPSIREMAERVAAVMGISVCGIDFVTTDITRPYQETGGAICEVNTLPDLGVHLVVSEGTPRDGANAVLDMLYPPGRRTGFPLVVVLREETDASVEDTLRSAWEERGYKAGIVSAFDKAGGTIGEAFADRLRSLDLETELDLGIIVLPPHHLVEQGLGYEGVDLAVVSTGETEGTLPRQACRVLERVADGRVLALNDPDLARRSFEALELGRKLRSPKALAPTRKAASTAKGKKAAPVPPGTTPARRKPALLPSGEGGGGRPRRARLQIRAPRFFDAGNIHARRPVIEVPIIGCAGAVVPVHAAQALGAIMPPLSDQVPEFGGWRRVTTTTEPVPVLAVVEALAVAAQRHAGWPVRFCAWRSKAEQGDALPETGARTAVRGGATGGSTGDACAVFEVATPGTGLAAANVALALASALLDGKEPGELQTIFLEEMAEFRQATAQERPDVDGLEIAREATRRGIGWSVVEGSNFLRLGSGRFAHVFSGSETTRTSRIGQRLAQSKGVTSGILARAGLPVPRQRVVRTDAEALDAVRAIGFPLVVRPAAGSRGRAVSVGITDRAEVLPALHRALAVSPEAIVESFVPGDEYRLLVVGGRFVAAAHRRPAQVRGDGTSTIRALVEKENARPERDRRLSRLSSRMMSLVPLALDKEALALLSEQGVTPESVPDKGRVVLLRRQSDHSYGGETVDVTDAVHSSIRIMAERAAGLLGIDVCGVDFITSDIARPCDETGGAISEVKSRPGLRLHYGVSQGKAPDVVGPLIDMLFPDGTPSRCPVVVLTGPEEETAKLRLAAEKAAARAGRVLGVVCPQGGVENLAPTTRPLRDVGAITWDKEVDAVLVLASAAEVAERGLGLERIDLAVLPASEGDPSLAAARRALARLAGNRVLKPDNPAARRRVLAALGLLAPAKAKRATAQPDKVPPPRDALAQAPSAEARPRPFSARASARPQPAPLPEAAVHPDAALPPPTEVFRPRTADATILMVGDIGFGESYMHLPRAAGLLRLLDDHGYRHSLAGLEGLLSSADLVIGNLEAPLSSRPDSALRGRKKYLGWSDPDRTVDALRQAGVHAVSLANNHALDCGAAGLEDTLARLRAAGIASFGAGPDLAAAERPFIRRFAVGGQERSLVVFGGFEHRDRYQHRYRWYARSEAPGVAQQSAERIGAAIAALRDHLPTPTFVAYPHWGIEYTEVNDAQREEAARLVEAGIDIVIGHGTHAAQTIEMVAGRPVVFGLGNFVWNAPSRYDKFAAQPYGLAAALVFRGKRSGGGTLLRLYPILTNNTVTKFQSRPVTRDEFAEAVGTLATGIKGQARRRSDKAGLCLELKLEGRVAPRTTARPAGFEQAMEADRAGHPVLSGPC